MTLEIWFVRLVSITLLSAVLISGCAGVPAATSSVPAQAGGAAGAAAAPAQSRMTLPEFLGFNALVSCLGQTSTCIRSQLGARFPGLEPKPPLLPIADKQNLDDNASPAVKTAAKVKAEEDQAAQNAKAIRYLSSKGCGNCFPDTEQALLEALEDCNEQTRAATLEGLRDSVGTPCQCCKVNSCCTEKLLTKIYELAYDRDCRGCYAEPSPRVRRLARLVLRGCAGTTVSEASEDERPEEHPTPSEAEKEQTRQEELDSEGGTRSETDGVIDTTAVPKAADSRIRTTNSHVVQTALPIPNSSERISTDRACPTRTDGGDANNTGRADTIPRLQISEVEEVEKPNQSGNGSDPEPQTQSVMQVRTQCRGDCAWRPVEFPTFPSCATTSAHTNLSPDGQTPGKLMQVGCSDPKESRLASKCPAWHPDR